MKDLEKQVFKLTVEGVDEVGCVKLSLRVRGDNNWVFVEDIYLAAGYSMYFFDNQKENGCNSSNVTVVELPRETWTEAIRDGTLDV